MFKIQTMIQDSWLQNVCRKVCYLSKHQYFRICTNWYSMKHFKLSRGKEYNYMQFVIIFTLRRILCKYLSINLFLLSTLQLSEWNSLQMPVECDTHKTQVWLNRNKKISSNYPFIYNSKFDNWLRYPDYRFGTYLKYSWIQIDSTKLNKVFIYLIFVWLHSPLYQLSNQEKQDGLLKIENVWTCSLHMMTCWSTLHSACTHVIILVVINCLIIALWF